MVVGLIFDQLLDCGDECYCVRHVGGDRVRYTTCVKHAEVRDKYSFERFVRKHCRDGHPSSPVDATVVADRVQIWCRLQNTIRCRVFGVAVVDEWGLDPAKNALHPHMYNAPTWKATDSTTWDLVLPIDDMEFVPGVPPVSSQPYSGDRMHYNRYTRAVEVNPASVIVRSIFGERTTVPARAYRDDLCDEPALRQLRDLCAGHEPTVLEIVRATEYFRDMLHCRTRPLRPRYEWVHDGGNNESQMRIVAWRSRPRMDHIDGVSCVVYLKTTPPHNSVRSQSP